jgi:uncharacterized membrane protein YhaH (DUF805 family)
MNYKEIIIATYLRAFKFSGYATRKEYATFLLFYITVYLLAIFLPKNLLFLDGPVRIFLAYILSAIAISATIPMLALGSRRLHDMGKSGWWQLLIAIPIFYLGLVFAMVFVPSITKNEESTNN